MTTSTKEIKIEKTYFKDIFSKWYKVPIYQRPYLWGSDQVNALILDLLTSERYSPTEDYFLGSFIFQHLPRKKDEDRLFEENDLLDGQQRLTTLLLMVAVIRDMTDNPALKETCQEIIHQKANTFKNIPEVIRIKYQIRENVDQFIEEFIKPDDGTYKIQDPIKTNNLSIANMSNAICEIRLMLIAGNADLEVFFNFILNKVLMVCIVSENLQDAFRMFTILNNRGLTLRNSDILKAENLGAVENEGERIRWAMVWEGLEMEFQDDFDRFISWIRTILVKEKARLNLVREFEDNIYGLKAPLLKKGRETFKLLEKYHRGYVTLFKESNFEECKTWGFDNLLAVMQASLPSTDWIPPLLAYFAKHKHNRILTFLIKLDNKFSGDWIAGYTPTERIENMNSILKEIEKCDTVNQLFETDVFSCDRNKIFETVSQDAYGKPFTKYLLLKLDYLFFDNTSNRMSISNCISVEHILPQQPKDKSQWLTDFSDLERVQVAHKLGNLILLGRRKNTELGRLEFSLKKEKYFKDSINTFPNSIRLMNSHSEWKMADFEKNHKATMSKLKVHYGLAEFIHN